MSLARSLLLAAALLTAALPASRGLAVSPSPPAVAEATALSGDQTLQTTEGAEGTESTESTESAETTAPAVTPDPAELQATLERLLARIAELERLLAAATVDVPGIVEQAAPAVVTVFTYDWLDRITGQGSGFFAYDGNVIMTNAHVLEDAEAVQVRLHDGRILDATQIWADPLSDLGLIWVEGGPYPTLKFGSSGSLRAGDPLVVIGSARGFQNTVTTGILSGIDRNAGLHYPAIQTDAAINPGNSGGPILNARGEVVGIASAKLSDAEGIGFGIPSDEITRLMAHFDPNQFILLRPWLGVVLSEGQEAFLGLPAQTEGLVVVSVAPEGGAAGLLFPGDRILWVDEQPVRSLIEMRRVIESYKPGDRVRMELIRRGRRVAVTVQLGGFNQTVTTSGSTIQVEPAIPPLWNPDIPWEDIF